MVAIFADSNRARIRIIKEDAAGWGVTPATGRTRALRFTGSTLNAQKTTAASEEIRADRMVEDHIETGARSSGEINVEFSAGSHDDLMEGFVMGAWTRPMTFDSVKGSSLEWADTDTLYVKGKDVTNYFFAGRRVRTQGFKTPANNDYFQIATITWNSGANRTEINMTATTAVAEKGSAYTKLYDANDVVVLKSTAIRAGTAGDSSFDSNGGNAFAAGIAAGQLVVGQKVYVEGLGLETGSVTFTTLPVAGAKVKVSDGAKDVTFQFGGSYAQTVTGVDLASDTGSLAENFYNAVNTLRVKGKLNVSATHAGNVVTLKNLNVTGGAIIEVLDTGAHIAEVNFTGGDHSVRGVFTLTAVTDDKISVSPAPATNANAGSLAVSVKGSMLRNPGDENDITPQSFSFETTYTDVAQTFTADGQRIGTMNYSIAANAILTGSYGLQGRAMTRASDTVLGAAPYTVLDTTATPVTNATVNVGAIKVNGETLSTAVQSIAMQGTNNLRDQNAVSFKFPAGIGAGRLDLTGTMVTYFANGDLWDKFIEHETVSVEWNLTDVEGHHYEWTVPAANFSTDTANPAGGNQDVLENLEWMAKRDPMTECELQVDRFSCILPPSA